MESNIFIISYILCALNMNSEGWIWWFLSLGIVTFVVTTAVLTIIHSKKHSHHQVSPVLGPPAAVSQKYAQALKASLTLFHIQKGMFVCIYPLLSDPITVVQAICGQGILVVTMYSIGSVCIVYMLVRVNVYLKCM